MWTAVADAVGGAALAIPDDADLAAADARNEPSGGLELGERADLDPLAHAVGRCSRSP